MDARAWASLSASLDGYAWLLRCSVTASACRRALCAILHVAAGPVPRFFSFCRIHGRDAWRGAVRQPVSAVFFGADSLFSFLLIGYWHHNAAAREGARMTLVVTSTGGLCLFAGVLLIGRIAGSYDLDEVLAAGDLIRSHELYLPALILILLGALTKSAQFPFHFWLPHAMAAPTPVSAYLHSAAMVKLGVFLMARLWPALAGTDAWMWADGARGSAFRARRVHGDLPARSKGLLAYSTMSHLASLPCCSA